MGHWWDKLIPLPTTNENYLQQKSIMFHRLKRRSLLVIVGQVGQKGIFVVGKGIACASR